MIERPILFSGEMVKAILEGRKTQTRRVIKPQPHGILCRDCMAPSGYAFDSPAHGDQLLKCLYGNPGDRLWVKETFLPVVDGSGEKGDPHGWYEWKPDPEYPDDEPEEILYRATDDVHPKRWKSGRFMPKKFARIWLEIVDIRVERVQEISEQDARAEGPPPNWCGDLKATKSAKGWDADSDGYLDITDPHYPEGCECSNGLNGREAFENLWDSINAKRGFGWKANPWVWVISFKQVQA